MRAHVRFAAALLAVAVAATPKSYAAELSGHALAAATALPDPAGSYTYAFDLSDGSKVNGTFAITHAANVWAATLTSDRTQGELKARTVEVTGDHAVLSFDTEYGPFTIDMTAPKDAAIVATWTLHGNDAQSGSMHVERAKP